MTERLEGALSHYRIVSLIGAGGMGAVLPFATMSDPTARARLVHEARMASSLNHPHIAHVYDVGEDRGHLFIAMELVEGRPLRDLIPPGGLSTGSLLQYGVQIADALAHAHEHDVIHRDLKSANIVITPEGRAKVLDFGLAKRLHGGADEAVTLELDLTATGMVLGTPSYLPPEVLLGAKADARSDVWAMGVVLYEMACGRLPFAGASIQELAGAITNQAPTPLSGHVPVGIQAVIARCLDKDPSHRYRDGGEVRAAIEMLMRAKAPRSIANARLLWLAVAGAAVVVLGLAFALNAKLRERVFGGGQAPPIASLAVLPLANLSGDPAQEYFADGMTEELITDLAPIPSLKVISRTSVMRFKNSKESLQSIARKLGVDAIVEGSVLRAGNRVRITAQLIEASSDHHLWAKSYERDFQDILALQSRVASDIAQEIRGQVDVTMKARLAHARPINLDAYELYLRGRYEWNRLTDDGMHQAIGYFEKALALDPGDARYSSGIADAYLVMVQVTGSVPVREGMAKVREYARRALAADENSAEAHASMGAALFFGDWNWKAAEQEVRRAIEINPGYPIAHLLYSTILISRGRAGEALEQDRLAMGLDPLSTIITWNSIGTLCQSRRYDDALALANRALELEPNSPVIQGSMVHIMELKGDFSSALDLLERFLPESEGGKERVAVTRRAFATSGKTGYWRTTLSYLDKVRRGTPAPDVGFAMLYTQLGDFDRAMEYLERAYQKHSGDMLYLKVEPHFDPIRRDPRFQALVSRVDEGMR